MQTFLPYSDFNLVARCLDRQRLGKQRVEAAQILATLRGESLGWRNHPAVKMWRGYEIALRVYGVAICDEWIARGYVDNQRSKFMGEWRCVPSSYDRPPWLEDHNFCASHRSNLLRKNFSWYGKYGWKEPPDLPYIWPV